MTPSTTVATRVIRSSHRVAIDPQRFERAAKGAQHAYGRYIALAVRLFQRRAQRASAKNDRLRHALEQAHVQMLPSAYIAFTWLNTLVATTAATIVSLAIALVAAPPSFALGVVLILVPLLVGATAYLASITYPHHRASERKRLIERDLPYAANYIAAMSSAGVIPSVLFRDLARERTYGEVAREMAWIVRDMELLGQDLLTALQHAITRSPSRRFQEFLQGAKTTILSGGDLKTYFTAKADQYMVDNRRVQREFLESLGIMAESYVTVVIAGPLFLIVMLSIMLVIGRSTASAELFLFFLIFLLLPIAHASFSWIIRNLTPEA